LSQKRAAVIRSRSERYKDGPLRGRCFGLTLNRYSPPVQRRHRGGRRRLRSSPATATPHLERTSTPAKGPSWGAVGALSRHASSRQPLDGCSCPGSSQDLLVRR
jgi:hypothetical protein